jgi:serpin B
MAKTLGLSKSDLADVDTATSALVAALQNPEMQIQLLIANSLWAGSRWPIKPEFLQHCRKLYRAEVRNVDFVAPHTADRINDWVKQQTHDKIDRLISAHDLNAMTMLILLNAIYFKGSWSQPFDPAITRVGDFHLPDGHKKRVRLMQQSGRYRYYEETAFQAVSLPYGTGRGSLMLYLPRHVSSLAEFQAQLTEKNWRHWLEHFDETPGSIALPRFKIEDEQQLNQPLAALGMTVAFSDQADFGNLSDVPARISAVRHKALMEVNEEGTVAAAATAVTIQARAMAPTRRFQFTLDRPFFCALVDNQTGAILFMGSIVDPQAA